MKTGGWTVRRAISRLRLSRGEIGRCHDPALFLPAQAGPRPFTFVFIRHPLTWYRSYWAYRMQVGWRVHPDQPITGWQTFGSVLDHECRADDFESWMRNILAYMPEGFLTRIYRIYTDQVDFTGRIESLKADLSLALASAGEKFSPARIEALPKENQTNRKWKAAAILQKRLAERVMEAENEVVQRWNYQSIPRAMLK
jgi:hypothetical protein